MSNLKISSQNEFNWINKLYDLSFVLLIFNFYSVGFLNINLVIYRIIYYLFIGLMLVKLLFKKKIKINKYIIWASTFFLFILITRSYAISPELSNLMIWEVLRSFIITIFVCIYLDSIEKIDALLQVIKFCGFFISIYSIIFFTNQLGSERFGADQFGNANILSLYVTISILVCIWNIFIERKIIWNILMIIPCVYVSFLTGSRKGVIALVLFTMILIIQQSKITNKLRSLAISTIVIFILYWVIFNTPIFYNIIGVRLEGLLGLLDKTAKIDESTQIRMNLITYGINLFKEKPFLGYGINNSLYYLGIYAHNNFVELMISGGIIGLTIYYSSYIYCFINLFKMKKNKYVELRTFFIAVLIVLLFLDYSTVSYYLWINLIILLSVFSFISLSRSENT